jgi:hypothetical protein
MKMALIPGDWREQLCQREDSMRQDAPISLKLPPVFHPVRILIFGMGDLGVKIAQHVVEEGLASVCMLAGKSGAAQQWAQLIALSTGRDVRASRVDGQDFAAVKKLLAEFEPAMIVQCATLLSPYALKGGFALQAAAQLPIVRTVMKARRALEMRCPVINCSYPDLTHPMLAAEGLAPDAGLGNVAIMALRIQRLLSIADPGSLRVIGHHAQLGASLAGMPASLAAPVPWVYQDGRKLAAPELLVDSGLQGGPTLNHLAAATAGPILRGFLDRDAVIETHAPGVFGLPGGYPVRFAGGTVEMRLPQEITLDEAVAFNQLAGAGEGIDRVDEDGTIFYTAAAKEAVAPWCPELAMPLALKGVEKRFDLLLQIALGSGLNA